MNTDSDFPEVPAEPTSDLPSVFDSAECPECGEAAYEKERGGGVTFHVCRSCKYGARELWKYANCGKKWEEVRQWVLKRDDRRCRACGDKHELHIHHIEKMVWYETTTEAHTPDNLVTLYVGCHRDLEGKDVCDHINEV